MYQGVSRDGGAEDLISTPAVYTSMTTHFALHLYIDTQPPRCTGMASRTWMCDKRRHLRFGGGAGLPRHRSRCRSHDSAAALLPCSWRGAEVLEALDCASIPCRGGIGLGITVWFRRFAMVSRLWHGTEHRYQVLWCSVPGSGGTEHQLPSVAEPVPQRGGLPVVISIVNSLVAPMGGVTVGGRILSGRQPRANSVNLAKRSSRMNRLSMLS